MSQRDTAGFLWVGARGDEGSQTRSAGCVIGLVAESKPSKEFKSGVWIEEGITGVVGGGGGSEEVIESEDEIEVIEDVDELEVEVEVDVSIGLGVGRSGIFGGFPRGSVLWGGLIFDGVGGEDACSVVGAELGEF